MRVPKVHWKPSWRGGAWCDPQMRWPRAKTTRIIKRITCHRCIVQQTRYAALRHWLRLT